MAHQRAARYGQGVTQPSISVRAVGREGQMIVAIDDFAPDPDGLRERAAVADFGAAGEHYPGIRAALPAGYMDDAAPVLRRALAGIFGRHGAVETIAASFSIVTTPPEALSIAQRTPHCDAHAADRFALIHYLTHDDQGGTAFYRHRATGFETVGEGRVAAYAAALRSEAPPDRRYVGDSDARFERIAVAEHRFNRAYLYPSFLLHSGAILAGAALSAEPREGRLTVTGFFRVG